MRRTLFVLSALVMVLFAMSLFAQEMKEAKAETVTGTLVDLTCYAKAGFLTNDHGGMKACGSACVKGGLPVGVVDANKKVHVLGVASSGYADFIGKEVRFSGTHGKHADIFLPEKFEVKDGEKWMEKALPKNMM
jgi:hypothetical protein